MLVCYMVSQKKKQVFHQDLRTYFKDISDMVIR